MSQKAYRRVMLTFIIVMLFFTFFLKTMYNYRLPTVTLALPMQGRLETEEMYDAIIPLEALHQDKKGYYVFTVQEKESVLGSNYLLERTSVDLLASDDTHVAVIGVYSDMPVVVGSTKEIAEGDRVNYQ